MTKVELNRPSLDSVTGTHVGKTDASQASEVEAQEGDTATLSTDLASTQALAATALNSPEIRSEKVDALRQVIQSGQYKVEPDKIAEAMIRD